MHYTVEELLKGNSKVARYYQVAKQKWDEFFETHRGQDVTEWAKWLTEQQIIFFEHECGGRGLGQEVMAWSGFGVLYSVQAGFADNRVLARQLVDAFAKSTCSLDVKSKARDAALSYHLHSDE
jgi:hypothetical protein